MLDQECWDGSSLIDCASGVARWPKDGSDVRGIIVFTFIVDTYSLKAGVEVACCESLRLEASERTQRKFREFIPSASESCTLELIFRVGPIFINIYTSSVESIARLSCSV